MIDDHTSSSYIYENDIFLSVTHTFYRPLRNNPNFLVISCIYVGSARISKLIIYYNMIKQLCISYKGLTYFSADIFIFVGYTDEKFSILI